MRSARLLLVAALAILFAMSSFSPVAAAYPPGIKVAKVTTNDDTTTIFAFHVAIDGVPFPFGDFSLSGGGSLGIGIALSHDYTITEDVPAGWLSPSVNCVGATIIPSYISNGVTVHFIAGEDIVCTFTNSPELPPPAAAPVGGVVTPANTLALVAPWLAVVGLVGCVGTVVVVAKKRRA